MPASVVDFTLYTNKTKVLKLTVQDAASVGVDLSGASGAQIYWIMQRGKDDNSDPQYKELGAGIAFFTDGTDGILLVTVDPADYVDLEAESASAEVIADEDAVDALQFWHQLSIELTSQPAITMEGTVTILTGRSQTVHLETEPLVSDNLEQGTSVTAGTLQTDENLAPASTLDNQSGVLAEPGVITTTVGS